MDSAGIPDVLEQLGKVGFFEAYHRTTFTCYRNRKDGGVQRVTVHIDDSGADRSPRYHVLAEGEDGTTASGNPDDDVHVALALVHWGDLDRTEHR